jgi:hypothetical protein
MVSFKAVVSNYHMKSWTLTDIMIMKATMTSKGAKLISLRFMVVVQQKSNGSRYTFEGPKGGTEGGNDVALRYGLVTTQRSDDHTRT